MAYLRTMFLPKYHGNIPPLVLSEMKTLAMALECFTRDQARDGGGRDNRGDECPKVGGKGKDQNRQPGGKAAGKDRGRGG